MPSASLDGLDSEDEPSDSQPHKRCKSRSRVNLSDADSSDRKNHNVGPHTVKRKGKKRATNVKGGPRKPHNKSNTRSNSNSDSDSTGESEADSGGSDDEEDSDGDEDDADDDLAQMDANQLQEVMSSEVGQ